MQKTISLTQAQLERFIKRSDLPITYRELLDCIETKLAHEIRQRYECELKNTSKSLRITLVENPDRIPSIKSIFIYDHETASNERLIMFNKPLPLENGLD